MVVSDRRWQSSQSARILTLEATLAAERLRSTELALIAVAFFCLVVLVALLWMCKQNKDQQLQLSARQRTDFGELGLGSAVQAVRQAVPPQEQAEQQPLPPQPLNFAKSQAIEN